MIFHCHPSSQPNFWWNERRPTWRDCRGAWDRSEWRRAVSNRKKLVEHWYRFGKLREWVWKIPMEIVEYHGIRVEFSLYGCFLRKVFDYSTWQNVFNVVFGEKLHRSDHLHRLGGWSRIMGFLIRQIWQKKIVVDLLFGRRSFVYSNSLCFRILYVACAAFWYGFLHRWS